MARFGVASALAVAAATFAVAAPAASTAAMTIAEVAAGNRDLSLLVKALTAANLVDVVADRDASLTVFAPTDAAFVSLAQALGFKGDDKAAAFDAIVDALTKLGKGDPIPTLTAILQYHVAAGVVRSTDLVKAGGYTPLAGPEVMLADDGKTLMDAAPAVADPKLVAVDVKASNGIVHLIDGVLLPIAVGGMPATPKPTPRPTRRPTPRPTPRPTSTPMPVDPTIADLVANNDDFSALLKALTAADLVDVFTNRSASLTVFAPTNDGFLHLAVTLGYWVRHPTLEGAFDHIVGALTRLGDGHPIPLLTRILTYHVLPGVVTTKELAGETVTTLEGGELRVQPWLRLVDRAPARRFNPKIMPGDVRAANGIVHVIDGVLLPLPVCPAYKEHYCRRTHRELDPVKCRCVRRRGGGRI